MPEHDVIALGEIHRIANWEVADAAARAALTPLSTDVGKVAWQLDDDSLWLLTDDDPVTWVGINSGDVGAGAVGLSIVFGDGVNDIEAGEYVDVRMPFAGNFTAWIIAANETGDIVFSVWLADPTDHFPPVVGDAIDGITPPTLTAADYIAETDLSDWTTAFNAGDQCRIAVASATDVKRVTLSFSLSRT